MLEIRNLHKSFGEQAVLNSINLSLEKGKTYTLIGGNGSGKTTLFNLITGFLKPDKGNILLNNTELTKKQPYQVHRKGIARTFQDLRLVLNISVFENLLLAVKNSGSQGLIDKTLMLHEFKPLKKKHYEKAEELLAKVTLTQEKNSPAGEISFGQQKLLTIGCCLANRAETLMLDEPVAGIDNKNYDKILKLIEDLQEVNNRTILQIEHNNQYIKETTDHIFFLHEGNNYSFDSYDKFMEDDWVNKIYLS